MATDIVPELLENIQRDFNKLFNQNKKLKKIREMIDKGTATYKQANEYAIEVGKILANVFGLHIKYEMLPDGKMYFNIAERILNSTLSNNHKIVAQISAEIQEQLNRSIGLGLKGIEPEINQNRIDSLINRIAVEETFENVTWVLQEPIVNFTQSVVDDTIKANANFQYESGLFPKIIRIVHGSEPCDWCKRIAGVYKYPDVPEDVYKRHDRCRCIVEYDPGDARKQNVWTKEWR